MPLLPAVLTALDLPRPELDAARLDGELYAFGDGFCSIAELDSPAIRAAALLGTRSRRLIADLASAAWVWGATDQQPSPSEFCVDLSRRARLTPADPARVREVVVDAHDVVVLAGVSVMHPLRTAVDLARTRESFSVVDAELIRQLAVCTRFTRADCDALMDRRRNLPGKLRAIQRLDQVWEATLSPR